MYRINDRMSAITEVQNYLRLIGNPEIFVAPTGVYDDNTLLSVKDFQAKNRLAETGKVDKETFDLMFSQFYIQNERDNVKRTLFSFITFPLLPGLMSDGMIHINKMMSDLLDYYGYTHYLRPNSFYSRQTAAAVKALRKIYVLEDLELIDESFYLRMVRDHNSIGRT